MIDGSSNEAKHIDVVVIRYKTEGGKAGEWTVSSPNVTDEPSARLYLQHHHPNYEFVGATVQRRTSGGGVVTKS